MQWDALWVPQTFEGFSAFFGVAVFSYGATIIIVEIQVRIPTPLLRVDSTSRSLIRSETMNASIGPQRRKASQYLPHHRMGAVIGKHLPKLRPGNPHLRDLSVL